MEYTRLGDSTPPIRLRDLSPARADNITSPAEPSLGRAGSKSICDIIDVCAVVASLACLVVAVCVVQPDASLSWKLGYEGQIVVLGFLIAIMNLCLKRVGSTFLLIFEARWGSSRLQNYEAILRNSIFLSQTHFLWRLVVFVSIALPLVLSIGYKSFPGGRTDRILNPESTGTYGMTPAPLGSKEALVSPVYLMVDAVSDFLAASANDSYMPPLAALPKAYGYNTLLLDNTSAALLDIPMPEYVLSIQRNLSGNEFWTISASVNATVSRYNLSSEAYRSNASLWKETFKYSASDLGRNGFTSYQLYNWYDFGLLPGNSSLLSDQPDGLLTFMGFYYELHDEGQTVISTKSFNDPSDPNSVAFRHNASMFNTRRERCEGTWIVNSTGIRLSSGQCSGTPTDQTVFTKEMADVLPVDALPILVSALHDFAAVRHSSPWKYPALTVSAATLYWSRMVFMMNGGTSVDNHWELLYPATDEKVTSTRTALRNHWVLYVVLVIQPVLILAAFSLNILFYSTPIGKGFGTVALLSGINGDCLEKIRGAAFTGELKRPVELRISVVDDEDAGNVRRIEYTFGRANGEALVSRELVYR